MAGRCILCVSLVSMILAGQAYAGGPLFVGGTAFPGRDGQPLLWNASNSIAYRTPSAGMLGKLDNAHAVALVQQLFQTWEDVPTASVRFQNAGAIQATGAYPGGAVDTIAKFDAVEDSCVQGTQTPIVFDANGKLFDVLFGPSSGVIGFASACAADLSGNIISAEAVLNGAWIDGNVANGELSDHQFDEAFIHEFGHLIGLDHSQISVDVINQPRDQCSTSLVAALPIMFPFAHCQSRVDAGFPVLSEDDQAWVSKFYPETINDPPNRHVPFSSVYGTLSGNVLFGDGETLAQGANVVAEEANGSNSRMFSVVSGYLFTGNPGQQVGGRNRGDGGFGSHDALRIGSFDIPVRAGSYTLRVESVFFGFFGGSSVGPLYFPIPIPGGTVPPGPVKVAAGSQVTGLDIVLTNQQPRFDQFEGK